VSLADNDVITGIKTFNTLPVLTPLNSVGVVHNDASGNLSTSLIKTADITNGAITHDKLDQGLVLPFNTTLNTSSVNPSLSGIVTKGFLASEIKPFTDTLSNDQPVNPITFYHITQDSFDDSENPVFTLSNKIRYIVDVPAKIVLPLITVEGIFYSLINKSGTTITISNGFNQSENDLPIANVDLIFNYYIAPSGDNVFLIETNQGLDFISTVTNGISCWHAKYY
jgi:hypothetical protein